jgi:hypothetical protein
MPAHHTSQAPIAPPPVWSLPESAGHQEERDARVAEMMARAGRRQAKATVRSPIAARVACLLDMLDRLCRECSAERSPERVAHLTDAIRDLETLIVRAILRPSFAVPPPSRPHTDRPLD